MKKKSTRWPIWRIAAAAIVCDAVAGVLYWLSILAERAAMEAAGGDANAPAGPLSLPAFVFAIAIATGLLGVFCVIWLVKRIRHDRIPPWERSDRRRL